MTRLNFFEKRLAAFQEEIISSVTDDDMQICMYDNWNKYFKTYRQRTNKQGNRMFNFTVMGIVVVEAQCIKHLTTQVAVEQPQYNVMQLDPSCIDIQEAPALEEHLLIWKAAYDNYLLSVIDTALNKAPALTRKEGALPTSKSSGVTIKEFALPTSESAGVKSKVIHFPISSANCGTLDGNIMVLQTFIKTLGLSVSKDNAMDGILCYDGHGFNLKETRNRQVFLDRVNKIVHSCRSEEAEGQTFNDTDNEEQPENERQAALNEKFHSTYRCLRQSLWNTRDLPSFVAMLDAKTVHETRDLFERTLLHEAVENSHNEMVHLLFNLGFNPNVQEKCGLSPLCLAIIKSDVPLVKLLLSYGADINVTIPNPLEIAKKLNSTEIIENLQNTQCTSETDIKELCDMFSVSWLDDDKTNVNATTSEYVFSRRTCKVPVFGDNGVEKLVRSVKIKSGSYQNFCECPGDVHASGYISECMAKTLGPGGMYYCLKSVLHRKNNEETFGTKKLQEGNLSSNFEACRDISMGFGLAAFHEFCNSEYYPLDSEVINGDKQDLLLKPFKLFIKHIAEGEKCRYFLQSITLFGPLMQLYKNSVRQGSGLGREVAWILSLYIYSQLQKTNYAVRSFVHCVNFLYAWPKLIRDVVRNHFSINVNGHVGHNFATDEYVETFMVKPLKSYATGQTSFKMLQRLSVSSRLIQHVRDSYSSAFAFKRSRHHKVPDALKDQIAVRDFALNEQFFHLDGNDVLTFNDSGRTKKQISAKFIDISDKGLAAAKKKFSLWMYSNFPQWRESVV